MSGTVESFIVSLAAGILVLGIGLLIEIIIVNNKEGKRGPRPVVLFVTLLMAVGIGLLAWVVWGHAVLVGVPDLSDLSRDEAELTLSSMGLVGAAQPQEAPKTRPEYVIPSSQNPLPGTKVHRSTLVRYSIATSTSFEPARTDDTGGTSATRGVSIFSPRDSGKVMLKRGADNIFRLEVEGTMQGVDFAKSSLLLWVQPIEPPSDEPGWYLQRRPTNGVQSVSRNTWRGIAQIGNQRFPPHDGDLFEVAASVVTADEATRLEARQGPMTTIAIPGVVSKVVRCTVRLK
jgi:hypothetical protein